MPCLLGYLSARFRSKTGFCLIIVYSIRSQPIIGWKWIYSISAMEFPGTAATHVIVPPSQCINLARQDYLL